ncbi:MAG: Fic family protein [Thermoplasmata archaeon]
MVDIKERAGVYVRQSEGYDAFIPKPLLPAPALELDNEMLNLLSQADRNLGRLDGATETLPNPDLFVFMYLRKEAVLSSQIEGTQASLLDLLEFEAEAPYHGGSPDVDEVANYVNAMNYGLDQIREGRPLSVPLLQEIHGLLLEDVRGGEHLPGELRPEQNWIGPLGGSISEAVFIPPPVPEMKKAMADLEQFLVSEVSLPPLIQVGLAHCQFETIHPFLDGNGRMGRLLITFLLTVEEYLQRPLLYLSHFFRQYRSDYFDRLQAVRDDGDWEGWLKFFLQGIYDVSRQATDTAKEIMAMREEHRQLIQAKMPRASGSALNLLEFLYKRPMVSVARVEEVTGLSFPAANRLVSRLEKLELLRETTGQRRYRLFAYQPYLDILLE